MSKSDHQKPIKLIYWKYIPNLGDLLSPFIIAKLSNRNILYKRPWYGWKPYFKELKRIVIHRQWLDWQDFTHPFEKVVVGVGSILHYANYNSIIWGSGFMNDHESTQAKRDNIKAVRGWLTANKVGCTTVGDPALLMPLLLPQSAVDKTFEIGFIPHYIELDDFSGRIYPNLNSIVRDNSTVINLRTIDIEKTISQICKCRLILSSSLHGLILAHAYGIPALWVRKPQSNIDPFKYWDYFSSVNLPQYDGFENYEDFIPNLEEIQTVFSQNQDKSLPDPQIITTLQKGLINVFPFK